MMIFYYMLISLLRIVQMSYIIIFLPSYLFILLLYLSCFAFIIHYIHADISLRLRPLHIIAMPLLLYMLIARYYTSAMPSSHHTLYATPCLPRLSPLCRAPHMLLLTLERFCCFAFTIVVAYLFIRCFDTLRR